MFRHLTESQVPLLPASHLGSCLESGLMPLEIWMYTSVLAILSLLTFTASRYHCWITCQLCQRALVCHCLGQIFWGP